MQNQEKRKQIRKVRLFATMFAVSLVFSVIGCGNAAENQEESNVDVSDEWGTDKSSADESTGKEGTDKSSADESTAKEEADKSPIDEAATKDESATKDETATKGEAATKDEDDGKAGTTAENQAGIQPEEEVVEYFEVYDSLNELAIRHGFTLGAAIGAGQMGYSAYKDMAAWHFGSLTATNEMKAYSLLDQAASKKSENGMPVMNYDMADRIVTFAQENGMGVRGHVLVWDAYMSDWFFREGYSWSGAYVNQETMKARLQYYIEEVITHFEEKFPGVVYCWDVVNEAVGDGASDYASGDARHVRTSRNGAGNPFYTYIGEDYVELSFLYAKNTVEKLQKENPDVSIKLFYNDYNTFYDEKRNAIIELVKSINSYAKDAEGNDKKLCDGVGMQSYIGGYGKQDGCMNSADLNRVKTAIEMYADLGLEVHATELAVRNYKGDAENLKKHAEFYGKLFQIYAEANRDGRNIVTNVSIWGLQDNPYMSKDDYSYKMNGPYCGLFDKNLCVKDSFRAVYKVLSEE